MNASIIDSINNAGVRSWLCNDQVCCVTMAAKAGYEAACIVVLWCACYIINVYDVADHATNASYLLSVVTVH